MSRVRAVLPENRVLSVNKVHRVKQVHKVYKVTRVVPVHRANKVFPVHEAKKEIKALRVKRATLDRKVSRALKETKAMLVLREKKEIKVTSDLKAKGAKQVCKVNKEYRVFKVKKGDVGPQGEQGETPVITVTENTPLSYKVNFKTSTQNITTPNLIAPLTEYHINLSATGSTLSIPLKNLILTYQNTSTTSLRISVAPKDTATPILTDIRRTTIYGGGTIEVLTLDNRTVSSRTVLDDLVYSQSQEEHSMKIRQQDPTTKLWSLCEIHSFISNGGARTSVWIQWSEYNVSYDVPTE